MRKIISVIIAISIILSFVNISFISYASSPIVAYNFEEDSEDWQYWSSVTGSKYTYPVGDASTVGDRALMIYDASKTSTGGIQSPTFEITAGTTYTALATSYVISGTLGMYLRFYDEKGTQLSSSSAAFDRAPWIEKSITATAPENSVKARIIICTTNANIVGAYLDDVKVLEGTFEGRGVVEGRIPEILPEIKEEVENFEILDDGYANGEVIHFQSFEGSIGEWKPYVNSKSCSAEKKNSTKGDYSLYINDTSDTLSGGVRSPKIPVAQGNTYTVHTDYYNLKNGVALYLRFYNSTDDLIHQATVNFAATGWRYGRISAKAPEGAVKLELLYASGVSALAQIYLDNIRVVKGADIIKRDESPYSAPKQVAAVNASIVEPVNDKLQYNSYNEKGDKLSDFSHAGYYGGKVSLPITENLPVSQILSPSGSDDTEMIQEAIDAASSVYSETKVMQVVKLKAGTYNINDTCLKLKSGVLISGEGQGPNGTVLHSTALKEVNIMEANGGAIIKQSNVNILDDYVKSGSRTVTVEDPSKFKAGDIVYIVYPSTKEWIDALKMSDVNTVYGDKLSWQAGTLDIKTSRTITEVNGNSITFDYGLFIPHDKTYAQSYMYKVDFSNLIQDLGVENLRVTSQFNGDPYDNNHAKMAIYVKRVRNMFVRNVTGKNLFNGVFGCRADSSQITVQNCSNLDPVSTIEGGNRYPFYADIGTEKILFTGCYSYDGRHDYMAVKGTTGPIVFSDSVVDMGNASSETHAGFATGVLYENVYHITDRSSGYIGLTNRGLYGTDAPQGWTAAGCVAWNCLSNSIIVHKPLLSYQNFSVGVWGIYNTATSEEVKKLQSDGQQYDAYRYSGVDVGPDSAFATKSGTPMVGDAYKEAEFTPVNPRSLFKAQLSERLTGTIKNAKPNAPVIIYPRPDKEVAKTNNQVSINGIFEKGATSVYVYIDDEKLTASRNTSNNTFETTVALSEGVHKIYATQVIDGIEGNKTADRFIIVGNKGNSNPQYLQSVYPPETLSFITNDTRPTYDEYLWDEGIITVPLDGKGTDESPYIIDSLEKFLNVFENGSKWDLSKVYMLSGFDETPMELPSDFKPLGESFTGKLIGGDMVDGKVSEKIQIINFNITTGKTTEGVDYILSDNSNKVHGVLFHKLDGATVKNLKFTGSVITSNTPAFLGTIAGQAKGTTIENVHNYASIDGDQAKGIGGLIGWTGNACVISNCSNHGNITVPHADKTARPDVGGIVGNMTSTTITNTYNYGNIQGRDSAGGISGYSNCNISKCANFGNITVTRADSYGYAGGITGRTNGGSIFECFNVGNITSAKYAGGITGHVNEGKTSNITNSFNLGKVHGEEGSGLVIGGFFGESTITAFYDISNNGFKTPAGINSETLTIVDAFVLSDGSADATQSELQGVSAEFLTNLVAQNDSFKDSNIWENSENYPYPNLKNNPLTVDRYIPMGEGTEENPFRIYFKEHLLTVNEKPDAHYLQMADIDGINEMLCADTSFSGVYDGNGMSITLSLDDTENKEYPKYVALFKKASGTIRNLNIRGEINAGYIDWQGGAAAFVGKAESGLNVTNCKNYASVTSTGHQTAGIVGNNSSWEITVTDCTNYGDITAGEKASGIIGVISSSATVQRCGNYGNITAGSRAAGISSWVYTWKWLDGNFNVGTITTTDSDGIACGLYADMVTTSNAKNIQKSFNAGNLYGNTTYGIAHIGDDGAKTIKIQNCYNAVYADFPVIDKTATNEPVITNCYYLSSEETDSFDGTIKLDKEELKTKAITGFSVSGNYIYPQITLNTLDEDRDIIDFSLVTINNNCVNSKINVDNYKDNKFYVVKNSPVNITVKPQEDLYSVDVFVNGEAIDNKITEEKTIEIKAETDINISVTEEIRMPKSISTITKGETSLIVNTTFYNINSGIVIVSGYKGEKLVDFKISNYKDNPLETELKGDIDKVKVMVWNSLSLLKPVTFYEEIYNQK